jgi:TonB family protein
MENGAARSESPQVRIQFVVLPDGSVHNKVEVLERSQASDKLEMCVIQAVKRWKFEVPKGGPARATLLLKR